MGADEFITAFREGRSARVRVDPTTAGWDTDAVIDALTEIIVHGDNVHPRASRDRAASALAHRRWMAKAEKPTDSRALDSMLPARIAPILLAALRDAPRLSHYRQSLLTALASIDAPTPEVIAAVCGWITDDDPRVAASATKAAGMLGVHAAAAADELERLLHPDVPGYWVELDGRWLWVADRTEIAGALARVSERPHVGALDALVLSVRGDQEGPASRAVEHLRDLGPRAAPAVDGLLAILHEHNSERPPVAAAIVAIAPDRLPGVLALLTGLSAGQDRPTAIFADHELLNLSRELGDSPEMRAVTPALIAALGTHPAEDRLALSKAVRRIDTRASRKAYRAFLRRERRERGASASRWTP
ncbi:hypothetical protein HN371_09950 [Candidatus Poribacteria bacterium]|nr:hypothetical protein [Candidatus Poribacteria bacterium]MBT5534964.1 hypothetical protein [Candidatus Poribacteria bacterium]MBT5710688.1 hypothetical protein [Candidatus Poribacteria bacterium]MBT7097330.1 hypothetical protein [Candidatus Poribacteria bacterium]